MSELGRRDGGRLDSLPNLLPPGLSGVRGSEPETLHDPLPPHQWRCFCCCVVARTPVKQQRSPRPQGGPTPLPS